MRNADQYLRFVRWSDDDGHYIGYCPDLFPWGAVCHGADEQETYRDLRHLIDQEVEQLVARGQGLPPAITRPMRETIGV